MADKILITLDDLETAVPLNAAFEAAGFATNTICGARRCAERRAPRASGADHPHRCALRAAGAAAGGVCPRSRGVDAGAARAHRLRGRRQGSAARRDRRDDQAGAARRSGGGGAAADRAPAAAGAHRHRGRERADPGSAGADRADGAGVEHGAHPGRVGHRQGARRQGPPRPVIAPRQGVHRGQLRGAARDAARERAVRPREGLVHRGGGAPAGPVRAGRRGHAVPRRDRRDLAGHPGEAPPGAGDAHLLPGGRDPGDQGGRAGAGGDQPEPPRRRRRWASSGRTCSTGSTSSTSTCRRSGSAGGTSPCWCGGSSGSSPRPTTAISVASPRKRWMYSSVHRGLETSGSSGTSSNRWWSWPPGPRSVPATSPGTCWKGREASSRPGSTTRRGLGGRSSSSSSGA